MTIAFAVTLNNVKSHQKFYKDPVRRPYCALVPSQFSGISVPRQIRPLPAVPFTACANSEENGTTSSKQQAKKQSSFGVISVLLFAAAAFWSVLVCIAMFIVHPFVLLSDKVRRRVHESLILFWMRDTLRSAFVRVKVTGKENLPSEAALFVANHQSMLDMFVLSFLRVRMRFLMPAKAMKVPFIGWMMSLAQWVRIGGADRRSQMNALKDVGEVLNKGSSVAMFPEGSPNHSGEMAKFASPAFRAARKSGVPVVPITINGTGSMFANGNIIPYRYPKERITVTVHPPISIEAGDDKEIASLAFDAVQGGLPENLKRIE